PWSTVLVHHEVRFDDDFRTTLDHVAQWTTFGCRPAKHLARERQRLCDPARARLVVAHRADVNRRHSRIELLPLVSHASLHSPPAATCSPPSLEFPRQSRYSTPVPASLHPLCQGFFACSLRKNHFSAQFAVARNNPRAART